MAIGLGNQKFIGLIHFDESCGYAALSSQSALRVARNAKMALGKIGKKVDLERAVDVRMASGREYSAQIKAFTSNRAKIAACSVCALASLYEMRT